MRKCAPCALPILVLIASSAMIATAGCDGVDFLQWPAPAENPPVDTDDGKRPTAFSTLVDDACPDDPLKTEPGLCGCGTPDTDTDSDGAPDCLDDCPENPHVVEVGAAVAFDVSFDDPDGDYADYYDVIAEHIQAAGYAWTQHMVAVRDVSIEVQVHFADIYTAHGGSARSVLRVRDSGMDVYEQGVAAEIRTGIDANKDDPDANITVGIGNLTNGRWWFDPDPWTRETPVPADRIDAFSTFLHELGHAFAYNGWRNSYDGALPGDYESTFDAMCTFDGENNFFVGEHAMEVYGGPVPLTYGNIYHLANQAPRPGDDLLEQLMNGVADHRGWRRYVSDLDLAILADTGLPIRGISAADGCDDVEPPATRSLESTEAVFPFTGPPVIPQEMNEQ